MYWAVGEFSMFQMTMHLCTFDENHNLYMYRLLKGSQWQLGRAVALPWLKSPIWSAVLSIKALSIVVGHCTDSEIAVTLPNFHTISSVLKSRNFESRVFQTGKKL